MPPAPILRGSPGSLQWSLRCTLPWYGTWENSTSASGGTRPVPRPRSTPGNRRRCTSAFISRSGESFFEEGWMPEDPMRLFPFVAAALVSIVLCLTEISPAGEGSPPAALSGSGMEKIVAARVNGVEITMESVATMMTSLGAKQGHGPASPESMEEIRKDALNQLILQELAYQRAKSEGLVVERKEIDVALADLRGKLGSEEKFTEFIEKERITEEEVRKRIERNLTLKRVFAKEVQGKVSVSEEETRKEYERDKERYARKE